MVDRQEQSVDGSGHRSVVRKRIWWIAGSAVALILIAGVAIAIVRGIAQEPDSGALSTEVPPTPSIWPTPSPGATEEIVRPPDLTVELNDVVMLEGSIVVRITEIEAVDGEAQGPGEIAGEALRTTAILENTGDEPVSLLGSAMYVSYGEENTPAIELSGPDRVPFPSEIGAGETATVALVFQVPYSGRDSIRITLDLLPSAPLVVYAGEAPRD